MSKMQLSTRIAAPIDRVFDAYSNFERTPQIVEAIVQVEMLTDCPVGVGTKFKETRIMFGREATEQLEVTAYKPNELITVSADSCGARIDSTFHFKPQNEGTYVEMELVARANTLLAKLMWPLGRLMMGSMKKMMQKDMQQIKAACENPN